jgi:hypothetical protein
MGDEKALIKVDDLAGLSKPADTLIKKTSKALGGLYLLQIRKVARAKADATIIEANANAEVEIIRTNTEITVSALQRRARWL